MRTWVTALADHLCSFCNAQIKKNEQFEILELPGVKSKFFYCREHAQTAIPLDVPNLPTEMELYTMGDMEAIRVSRERMQRLSELTFEPVKLSGRDRQVKE